MPFSSLAVWIEDCVVADQRFGVVVMVEVLAYSRVNPLPHWVALVAEAMVCL